MNLKNKPIVSYLLIAINIIIFIAMMLYDHTLSYTTLVDFGAKVNFRIADYQFFNLFMPMFLHSSFEHLLFNMGALFYFGPLIENILGKIKFLASYLIIGLLTSAGSFIFSEHVSLGASGVIFGFMGFHLVLFLINKERYLKVFGNSVIQLLVVNLVFTFIMPNIDIAGHLVGFFAGFAFYYLLLGVKKSPLYTMASLLIIVSLIGGLVLSIPRYKNSENYFLAKAYYLQEKNDRDALIKLDSQYQDFLKSQSQ